MHHAGVRPSGGKQPADRGGGLDGAGLFETDYQHPRFLHTLALMYASNGRLDEAVQVATKARDIALESGTPADKQLAAEIDRMIKKYESGQRAIVTPTG